MNVAGWYITRHNAALGTKTRLTCFALIGCTLFNWVSCIADRRRQLSASVRVSIATQLNSTQLDVELSCVAINGPLLCGFNVPVKELMNTTIRVKTGKNASQQKLLVMVNLALNFQGQRSSSGRENADIVCSRHFAANYFE